MFEPLAEAIRSRRARRTLARQTLATAALRRRRHAAVNGDETADLVASAPARSSDRAKEFVERLRHVPDTEQDAVASTLSELAEVGAARRVPPTG